MIDLRIATKEVATEFDLPLAYAIQCPAPDSDTTDFYISQADKSKKVEDLLICRNVAVAGSTKMKLTGYMRLVGAGHGTAISVLRRNGKLGIVCNAWEDLVWIPFQADKTLRKGDVTVVPGFWPATYAHVDHEAKTACLRSGDTFKLYELNGDKLGTQLGSAVESATPGGPFQGFGTMKSGGTYHLFTLWDYGQVFDKPTIVVSSFNTADKPYKMSARVLPARYVTQEPEGCYVKGGKFHLGMSSKVKDKTPIGVRFNVPVKGEVGTKVKMYVRPKTDPIWKDAPYILQNRVALGASGLGTKKRAPGFCIKGVVVIAFGKKFVKTLARSFYNYDYLTFEVPKK